MRNEIITKLSDILEENAAIYAVEREGGLNPTEEETVAALVAAAFGMAKTPVGYAAFNTAVKAAQALMDRVQIPVDGHYLELEAAHQRRHDGRPSPTELERLARNLATREYYRLASSNGEPGYHEGTFLTNYPTKDQYVNEWWEERYLPVIESRARPKAADLEIMDQTGWKLNTESRFCYYDTGGLIHGPECRCSIPADRVKAEPQVVPLVTGYSDQDIGDSLTVR